MDLEQGLSRGLPENITHISLAAQHTELSREADGASANEADVSSTVATLFARHHFGEGWAADLALPVGIVQLKAPNLRTQRISGYGDFELGGRYDLAGWWGTEGYRPSLTLRLGLSLPTGRRSTKGVEVDVSPTSLSIGSGTFGTVTELQLTQFLHRAVALTVPISLRQPLSRTEADVQVAATFRMGIGALLFPTDWLVLRAAVSSSRRGQDESEREGALINSGGHWLRSEVTVAARLHERIMLSLGGGLPLLSEPNGRQVSESFQVNGALTVRFGGDDESDEDEHDHGDDHGDAHDDHGDAHGGHDDHGDAHDDHGDAHDGHDDRGKAKHGDHHEPSAASAGDVLDLAVRGASFTLAKSVVAGKITIIDFWASWCEPCHKIDADLRQLAAAHPRLAIRRVEVPSEDTAVAEEHLPDGVKLPQVWLFDEHSRLIGKRIGVTPAAIRREIEALVQDRR